MKKLFCCPALELFHCLPLWKTVRLHGKKLQNATKLIDKQSRAITQFISDVYLSDLHVNQI